MNGEKPKDYKEEQRQSRQRLRMGLICDSTFFNRGARQAKQQRADARTERRQLLREMKRTNGGKRVNLHA